MIVFDTEATDLTPGQICQLSYLVEEEGQVSGHNYYFSVDDMNPDAQEVHGLSMDQLTELSGGQWFEDVAQQILADFNIASLVVGHNVAADERYLQVEMQRAGLKLKKLNTFCTMNYASGIMNMARKVVTGRPKPPKLSELADYYGITPQMAEETATRHFGAAGSLHDARYDTAMTYLCLKAAIQKGDLRGL